MNWEKKKLKPLKASKKLIKLLLTANLSKFVHQLIKRR